MSKIHLYTNVSTINLVGSSNIIDLCPVGALTLKKNQFVARPWEFKSIVSFDFADSFGLPVVIDFKNTEVVRILPYLDSVFNLEFISDFTRLSFESIESYNKLYKNNPNNNNDHINYRAFKLFNVLRFTKFKLPVHPLYSFKVIKNTFQNLMGAWKSLDFIIKFFSNFNDKYILSINILNEFKNLNSIFINKYFHFFMYRFFIYLNDMNKVFNNIFYIVNEDINFLNVLNLNINKHFMLFKDSMLFKNNKTKFINITKYLSFFKILLNFDDIINLGIKNLNTICKRAKKTILLNYSFIENKVKKNLHIYSINNMDYDSDLVFNLFGFNMISNLKLKIYNKIYRQDIIQLIKRNVIN